MSGYYGRNDPDAQWNNALAHAGGAFANMILSNRQATAKAEQETATKGAFDKVVTGLSEEVEPGKTRADVFGEKKNPHLAFEGWLHENGIALDNQQRARALTLLTLPAGDGPDVVTMPGEDWAHAMGLPDTGRFKGFVAKHNTKTGNTDWLYQPPPAKEPEPLGKIGAASPEKYTGASLRKYQQTGDPTDLELLPEKAKEAPDAFDVLTAAEKAELEKVSGLTPGTLRDTPVQRDRKTGRLHNLPGQLDALQKLMLGAGGPASAAVEDDDEDKPGFLDKTRKALGLGGEAVPEVRSQAEYDKLPAGASYMSGGKRLIKRGQ